MSAAGRLRVNHWSPWGSDESGIANYTSHLVPALNSLLDVTVVHPTARDKRLRTRAPRELTQPTLDDADVNIFHVGNHLAYHHWMIGPLMREGGIVVLHDWSIFDIFRPMFYRSWHLWERELAYNGETSHDLGRYRGEPGFLMEHPLNRRVIEAADVVIVHTTAIQELARRRFPHSDVRYIPHGGHVWPSQPVTANSPITVLGGIGRHKQVSATIEAFAKVAGRYPSATLRIVGRGDDRAEIQRLRDLALELNIDGRVEWHLNVDRSTYLRLLGESLLIVTLRSDTAGEMSGVLVEAWGAGRVGVTSDQPQFRGFDESFCRRVALGERAAGELATILADALNNPVRYGADGHKAREFIAGEYSFENVAQQYANVVEELASRDGQPATSGINVYGSWGTPSGVVEGARRHARALLHSDVAITLPYGFRLPTYDVHLVPGEFAAAPHRARYAINLLTANINEFHEISPSVLGGRGSRRWNIATWIYEFAAVPAVLVNRFALVDEIWALSSFAATTFSRYFDGPILRLPHVVHAAPMQSTRSAVRQRHGLRPDATVVMYSFDFGSGWARKNPLAVVRAFRDAVATTSGLDAQLVLKVSGLQSPYRELLANEMSDVDGVLVDTHLSDAEFSDLLWAIDIYCSLHRAEGFGLGLAETMARGKLAIATNYSGNLDFMNETNALLVNCSMRELDDRDVAANEGMRTIVPMGSLWAEPDHDDAVRALCQAFSADTRQRLGAAAAIDIARSYSSQASLDVMRSRLKELPGQLAQFRTSWPRL